MQRIWIHAVPLSTTCLNEGEKSQQEKLTFSPSVENQRKKHDFTTNTNNNDDDYRSCYAVYLNQRVQRPLVRCLPRSYSFFHPSLATENPREKHDGSSYEGSMIHQKEIKKDGVNNNDGKESISCSFNDEQNNTNNHGHHSDSIKSQHQEKKEEEEILEREMLRKKASKETERNSSNSRSNIDVVEKMKEEEVRENFTPLQQVPFQPTALSFTHVPLPADNDKVTGDNYSHFFPASSRKDASRSAQTFLFSFNYDTHIPGECLIHTSIANNSITTSRQTQSTIAGISGYTLQLPIVTGTVVGYSPPLSEMRYCNRETKFMPDDQEGATTASTILTSYPLFEFELERQKEDEPLFRILWDGSMSGIGYVEDVTLDELLPCLSPSATIHFQPSPKLQTGGFRHKQRKDSKQKKQQFPRQADNDSCSKITIPPKLLESYATAIHKHVYATVTRKQLSLDWKINYSILPPLIVLAGLELRREIAQKVRLEILLEKRRLIGSSGSGRDSSYKDIKVTTEGKLGMKIEEELNSDGTLFQYYRKHPNQYMSSFQPPSPLLFDEDENEEDENEEGVAISTNVSASLLSKQQVRRKARLTKEELTKYNEKVLEQCHFTPSKLAERIRLACSLAFDYASRKGLLDDYHLECERRKKREKIEIEKIIQRGSADVDAEVDSSSWVNCFSKNGEARRSSRAKDKVDYSEDGGLQVVENLLEEREGVLTEAKQLTNISLSDCLNNNVSGGPSANFLLGLFGWYPKGEFEELNFNGITDKETDVVEDQFFEPTNCLIIDLLGHRQRYLSPANIQGAIVRAIKAKPLRTPKCLLDEELLREIQSNNQNEATRRYLSNIENTSNDDLTALSQMEPVSFARCKFAPRIFLQESDTPSKGEDDDNITLIGIEAQKQADAEASTLAKRRKEARIKIRLAAEQKRNAEFERAYRARKSFELWRFKSIHGNGCTVWPLWSARAQAILKEMYDVSLVNSTIESVSCRQHVSSVQQVKEASSSQMTDQVNVEPRKILTDEELALSLVSSEYATDDYEPQAKRRRTTRRGTGADEPVYYGSYQSISREQLISTLVRLLRQAKPGSSSIIDLKHLVFATDYDSSKGEVVEWKKLRGALGHLLFRLGQVGRLVVDADGDTVCWNLLKEGALVKFTSEHASNVADDLASYPEVALSASIAASTTQSAVSAIGAQMAEKLTALEKYVQLLHAYELSLRAALLKAIDKGGQSGESLLQISTVAISTGADEIEGDTNAEDWRFFNQNLVDEENDRPVSEITWRNSNHKLLGEFIFRPSSSPFLPREADTDCRKKCKWYKIVSYTPSVKGDPMFSEETPKLSVDPYAFEPNPIVERRARFRAIPVAACDIDDPASDTINIEENDHKDIDFMILTESQVRAGIEAANLYRRIERNSPASSQKAIHVQSNGFHMHPFRNKIGSRVMLTPLPSEKEDVNGGVIYGIITGFDYFVHDGAIKDKLLILLDRAEELDSSKKKSCACWSTVKDATFLTEIVPDSPEMVPLISSIYSIEMDECFQGSEAYNVCESVVNYLRKHPKSGPFLEPVNPTALGIPHYHDTVKNPMDLSTLARNLKEGKYSRIPPTTDEDEDPATAHPVYRMAYGPFYDDLILIFDNAILFNGLQSWIGVDASVLKKNALRKIEQAIVNSTASHHFSETGSRHAKMNRSKEEDSDDTDLYKYESDFDEEDYGKPSKHNRHVRTKRVSKTKVVKEEIPMKAIERPYAMPESAADFGHGAFPHIKIQTDVNRFSLPQDWSCRYVTKVTSEKNETNDLDHLAAQTMGEDDEMLALLKLQQEEDSKLVRRSSRSRTISKTYTEGGTASSFASMLSSKESTSINGVEYYFMDIKCFDHQSNGSKVLNKNDKVSLNNTSNYIFLSPHQTLPTKSMSRLGVEGIREALHEHFYARLYWDQSPNALILENEFGKYVDGSFPPYLGRVFDCATSCNTRGSASVIWEIREQYLIPALRWVLRGLVRSGHLSEVNGSLSEGISPDNDGSTGARAGMSFSFSSGIVVPNHEYYYEDRFDHMDVLDEKEILRKRRALADMMEGVDNTAVKKDQVEMSAYEKMRAERVARNAERLKALGLA